MRRAVLAGVLVGAFAGLFLVAEDIALVIAAVIVGGAWVRLVLLGDGERELQGFERTGPTARSHRPARHLASRSSAAA
jgi:hypothetical protein